MLVTPPRIVTRSTRDVAPKDRLSYAISIAPPSTPYSIATDTPLDLELDVSALGLPSISAVAQRGSRQRAIRSYAEIRRSSAHAFNLVLVLSGTFQVTHGIRSCFGPGDLIFHDSRYPLDCEYMRDWSTVNLQLSEQFVRKWLPYPSSLAGRRIAGDSAWGRVLASYVGQLSPHFFMQPPLPREVLIDQLGALLALTATDLSGQRPGSTPAERSLRDHVYDQIRQRCADTSLQATDIASTLNTSKRTMHRVLAACGETFGAMLIQARVDLAIRMLQSPLFDRVTTAEVGRRAGFSDASHFTKVLRRFTGQTPRQMRKTTH
jgi:AraC-like DNA-binding protein